MAFDSSSAVLEEPTGFDASTAVEESGGFDPASAQPEEPAPVVAPLATAAVQSSSYSGDAARRLGAGVAEATADSAAGLTAFLDDAVSEFTQPVVLQGRPFSTSNAAQYEFLQESLNQVRDENARMSEGGGGVPDPRETSLHNQMRALESDPGARRSLESATQFMRDVSERARVDYGVDQARDEALTSKIIGGASSLVPALASGPLAPVTIAGMMAEGGRKDAAAAGATPEQEKQAFYLNAAVGAMSEALLGVPALLRSAKAAGMRPETYRELVKTVAAQTVKSSVREGAQEGVEQTAQNVIAAQIAGYDPARGTFENVPEAIALGAVIGAPVGAVVQTAASLDAKPIVAELEAVGAPLTAKALAETPVVQTPDVLTESVKSPEPLSQPSPETGSSAPSPATGLRIPEQGDLFRVLTEEDYLAEDTKKESDRVDGLNRYAVRRVLDEAGLQVQISGWGTWYITAPTLGVTVRVGDHTTPANSASRPLVVDDPDLDIVTDDWLEGVLDALAFLREQQGEKESPKTSRAILTGQAGNIDEAQLRSSVPGSGASAAPEGAVPKSSEDTNPASTVPRAQAQFLQPSPETGSSAPPLSTGEPAAAPAREAEMPIDYASQITSQKTDFSPLTDLTSGDLATRMQEARDFDKRLEAELFGEEGAKKYRRLLSVENSMDPSRSDRAFAEREAMEAALTDAQRTRLFKEAPEYDAGELRDLKDAVNFVENAASEKELGRALKFAATRFDPDVSPQQMTFDQAKAMAEIKAGARVIESNGWNSDRVANEMIQSAAQRFADPNDAPLMLEKLRRYFKPEQGRIGREPAPALPASSEPLSPVAGADPAPAPPTVAERTTPTAQPATGEVSSTALIADTAPPATSALPEPAAKTISPGQKVSVSGETYEFVKENADGTITVRSGGGEFDTAPGEQWTPIASAKTERASPLNTAKVSREQHIADELSKADRLLAIKRLEAEAKIRREFTPKKKLPVGVSKVSALLAKDNPTKAEQALIREYERAAPTTDRRLEREHAGRVWDQTAAKTIANEAKPEAVAEIAVRDASKPEQMTKAEAAEDISRTHNAAIRKAQETGEAWDRSWKGMGGRAWGWLTEPHEQAISIAVREARPVSAAAVDAYGIKLPPGYVKRGELYVFEGAAQAPPASGAKLGPGAVEAQPGWKQAAIPKQLRTDQSVAGILAGEAAAPTGPQMKRGEKGEAGALFGTGGTRQTVQPKGSTPRGDTQFLRIPSALARIGRGLLTEGAADVTAKSKNKVGQVLSKAMNRHVDLEQEIHGQLTSEFDRAMTGMPKARAQKALDELTPYLAAKENGRPVPALSGDAQKILTAWENVAEETGLLAEAHDVQVFDPTTGGHRPMHRMGRAYVPRMFRKEVQRVMQDPKSNPRLFNDLVADVAAQKGIPEADAANLLRGEAGRFQAGDFMGNLEMARTGQFPESFYDYDLRNLAARFVPSFAERMGQIISYGQRLGPRDAPLRKNLWDVARGEAEDSYSQQWLRDAEDQAVNLRSNSSATQWTQRAQTVASGLLLSSPTTSVVRNTLSGLSATTELLGVRRSIEGLVRTATSAQAKMDAREIGAVRDNLGDFLHADQLAESKVDELFRGTTTALLKYSGYTGSEGFVRTHAAATASQFAKDGVAAIAKDPKSRAAKEALALFKRMDTDAEQIVAEGADWKTGAETRKFVRTVIRDSQGGYKFNQVPLWANSPVGRFFYQFGRYGTQRARNIWRNGIKPLIGEEVEWHGKTMTRRDATPILKMAGSAVVLGEVFGLIASGFFDRDRKDASLAEISAALSEDEKQGALMAGERLINDVIMAGTLGIWGQPVDVAKSLKAQSRFKNPFEPPGMAATKAVLNIGQAALDQGGKVTKRDTIAFLGQLAPGIKQASDVARNVFDEPLYEAENDVRTLRNAAMRWAQESGMDAAKIAAAKFRKSENAPAYEGVQEALLVGDVDSAKMRAAKFVASQPDSKKAEKALKSSVKQRQPFRVGPYTSAEHRGDFMAWAKNRLPAKDYEQAKRVQERYEAAAVKAELW